MNVNHNHRLAIIRPHRRAIFRAVLEGVAHRCLHELLGEIHIPLQVAEAISGSTIQNSAACREVFEFSARKVGPKVYTFDNAQANVSASSWPSSPSLAKPRIGELAINSTPSNEDKKNSETQRSQLMCNW